MLESYRSYFRALQFPSDRFFLGIRRHSWPLAGRADGVQRGTVVKATSQCVTISFDVSKALHFTIDSGQQLRLDDPSALKDIVAIVQSKISGREGSLRCR